MASRVKLPNKPSSHVACHETNQSALIIIHIYQTEKHQVYIEFYKGKLPPGVAAFDSTRPKFFDHVETLHARLLTVSPLTTFLRPTQLSSTDVAPWATVSTSSIKQVLSISRITKYSE